VRTIVFSDVHGEPDIIAAVVAHSGFDASVDRLVFAGDAIEIGRDTSRCLDLLEELGAECLVGNQEYGVFTGALWRTKFSSPRSFSASPSRSSQDAGGWRPRRTVSSSPTPVSTSASRSTPSPMTAAAPSASPRY